MKAPNQISGLDTWLRAIDIDVADGAEVTSWADVISGRTYTNAVNTGPTYKEKIGIAERPALFFDGANNSLLLSGSGTVYNFLHDGTDNTFFAVFLMDTGSKEQWLWADNNDSSSNTGVCYRFTSSDFGYHHISKGSAGNSIIVNTGSTAFTPGDTTIEWLFVRYDNGAAGDDDTIYVNGTADTTDETANTPHAAGGPTNQPIIGRKNGTDSNHLDAYLFEMGFFNEALSDSDISDLSSWFASYYGKQIEFRDVGTPKLTYNSVDINFPKKFNSYRVLEPVSRARNHSTTGSIETLKFFTRHEIEVQKNLIAAGLKDQIETFFDYANDGSTLSFEYDDDIGLYFPFEGKTLTSNDGTAGTTTRSGAANYVDASTGLVTSAAANTARFEQGKFNNHAVLVERAVTNYCQRSEEFDHADWAKTAITVTANPTYVADPEGTFTADRLDTTNATNLIEYDSAQATSARGVFSVWLRSFDANVADVSIRLTGTGGGAAVEDQFTVTPVWTRHEVANTSTPTTNWRAAIFTNATGDTLFAWGAQIEDGEEVAQSYIQGSGADGTTSNENHTSAIGTTDINLTNGSLTFWLYPNFEYDDAVERWMFKIENAANEDFLRVVKNSSNNFEMTMRLADDTASVTASGSASYLVASTWQHIAVTWDTTIANGLNTYYNGTLKHTSVSNPFLPIQIPTNVLFGKTTSASLGGRIDEATLWKKTLSATEISRLSSATTAANVGRNRWDSLRLLEYNLAERTAGTNLWNWNASFVETI